MPVNVRSCLTSFCHQDMDDVVNTVSLRIQCRGKRQRVTDRGRREDMLHLNDGERLSTTIHQNQHPELRDVSRRT